MRKSLSEKELECISKLELKQKYFFTRDDIREFFRSDNEMSVYIHRLKKKNRIIKLNQNKYFLIPIKAMKNNWSEHPFILIDEIMNGKDYCIIGQAAKYYWKFINQIPFEYTVYNTKMHKKIKIFNVTLNFKKRKKQDIPIGVIQKIQGHTFIILNKNDSEKWNK